MLFTDLTGKVVLGLGGFLAGIGSLLSGWAAWKLARRRGKEEDEAEAAAAEDDEKH